MSPSPEEDPSAQAMDLVKRLVGLLDEKWITSTRFIDLADHYESGNTQARIVLLTGLKALARDLPVQAFPDTEARERLLQAAQEALDRTISAEDADN